MDGVYRTRKFTIKVNNKKAFIYENDKNESILEFDVIKILITRYGTGCTDCMGDTTCECREIETKQYLRDNGYMYVGSMLISIYDNVYVCISDTIYSFRTYNEIIDIVYRYDYDAESLDVNSLWAIDRDSNNYLLSLDIIIMGDLYKLFDDVCDDIASMAYRNAYDQYYKAIKMSESNNNTNYYVTGVHFHWNIYFKENRYGEMYARVKVDEFDDFCVDGLIERSVDGGEREIMEFIDYIDIMNKNVDKDCFRLMNKNMIYMDGKIVTGRNKKSAIKN